MEKSKSDDNEDYVAKFFKLIKRNKLISGVIIICTIITAVASFSDAPVKIKKNYKDLFGIKDPVVIKYKFESGNGTFNILIREKMEKDGYLIDEINPTCWIVMKVDRNPGSKNQTPKGADYFYSSSEIKICVCDTNKYSGIGVDFPGTEAYLTKDLSKIDKVFDTMYSAYIIKNIDRIYDSIKKQLPKK